MWHGDGRRCALMLALVLGGCDDDVSRSSSDAGAGAPPPIDAVSRDMSDDRDVEPSSPDSVAGSAPVDAGPMADAGPVFRARPRNPPASSLEAPRGFTLARGLIHMHSVFSHDACDGMPLFDDGSPNAACHQRFRDAMCHNRHDFVLLTDHPDSVAERTLIEALYHQPGDTTETLDGALVGNRIHCDDGHTVWLSAGSEGDLMPVLFRQMPEPGLLRDRSPDAIARLKREAGALVLQAHMERFDGPTAAAWDLDGQEIYNIHANLDPRGTVLGGVMPDIARLLGAGFDGPHPDLWFTGIFRPGEAALATWDWTIARTAMLGFAGSDTHENVPLPIDTGDGERIESYRRIGGWFSNRLLLDGPVGYASVRRALEAGRLYVVFDAFGLADGFDVHALTADGQVVEMGGQATFAPGAELRIRAPRAPASDRIEVRVYRVTEAGRTLLSTTTDAELLVEPPGPGAYRVEVWSTPAHLGPEMGVLADDFVRHQPWIYANPIYLWPAPDGP